MSHAWCFKGVKIIVRPIGLFGASVKTVLLSYPQIGFWSKTKKHWCENPQIKVKHFLLASKPERGDFVNPNLNKTYFYKIKNVSHPVSESRIACPFCLFNPMNSEILQTLKNEKILIESRAEVANLRFHTNTLRQATQSWCHPTLNNLGQGPETLGFC